MCTEDLFLLFPIKILAQKTCLPFRSPVSVADSHTELRVVVPQISAFPATNSLLLWLVGLLISPGGDWAVGAQLCANTALKQCKHGEKWEARREAGAVRLFCFL